MRELTAKEAMEINGGAPVMPEEAKKEYAKRRTSEEHSDKPIFGGYKNIVKKFFIPHIFNKNSFLRKNWSGI